MCIYCGCPHGKLLCTRSSRSVYSMISMPVTSAISARSSCTSSVPSRVLSHSRRASSYSYRRGPLLSPAPGQATTQREHLLVSR
jgi:hypothetical protein